MQNLFKATEKKKHTLQSLEGEFLDFVTWLASEGIAISKIGSFANMHKYRGKKFKSDRQEAFFVVEAVSKCLKSLHDEKLEKAFATALTMDDGSSLSSREWLAVVARADTYNQLDSTICSMFLYCLKKLEFNQLDSQGLQCVLEKACGVFLSKVFWFGRDGAAVFVKMVRDTIHKFNPYALDMWCHNHRGNLLLRDCIHEDPDLWELIDMIERIYNHFHYSNKATSILQKLLPPNWTGPVSVKRSKNLTRWVGLQHSCHSLKELYPYVIKALVKELQESRKKDTRVKSVKKMLSYWLDYRKVALLLFLLHVSEIFASFHNALQDRSADFTTSLESLASLNAKIGTLLFKCNDISENAVNLINMVKDVVKNVLPQIECPAKMSDCTKENAMSLLQQTVCEFQDSFKEGVNVRFPKENCEISNAFTIFDPNKFPRKMNLTSEAYAKQVANYGLSEISVLTNWYGVMKSNDEEKFDPIIDSEKVMDQWITFRPWLGKMLARGSVTSFKQLIQAAYDQGKRSATWHENHSEIFKLLKILEVRPESTAENERVFSNLKDVLGIKRTRLTDAHVEDLVKLSFESKRMFGENKYKLFDLARSDHVAQSLKERKKKRSQRVSQHRKAAKANAGRQPKRKNTDSKADSQGPSKKSK